MSLPTEIRVRISSEGAEGIGITPVVAQDMPLTELVEQIMGVAGKDAPRVREILGRGSMLAGASRFRWAGIDSEIEEIIEFLRQFPESNPDRPFDAVECHLAVLRSDARSIVIEREAGLKRRLFKKRSFWEELMSIAVPEYVEYSYRERADLYRWKVRDKLPIEEAAKLLAFSSYESQLRGGTFHTCDLYVRR